VRKQLTETEERRREHEQRAHELEIELQTKAEELGTNFTCFTGTKVQKLTQKRSAAGAHVQDERAREAGASANRGSTGRKV